MKGAVKMLEKIHSPRDLDGMSYEDLDQLATDALNDACYPGNPREADKEQVIAMFRQLM